MEIVCSLCGISGKIRSVSEVISPRGIILACNKCALEEGYPILTKPKKKLIDSDKEKSTSVHERMIRLSGVKPRAEEQGIELRRQEKTLSEIANRNYQERLKKQTFVLTSRPDLTEKFNWIIMRVRRMRGLTQKQLAEMIKEPEAAIKMAEQGIVPEGYALLDKLERFLKVRLIKERTRPSDAELKERKNSEFFPQPQKTLNLDRKNLENLTIADLQRMKREKEREENLKNQEEKAENG